MQRKVRRETAGEKPRCGEVEHQRLVDIRRYETSTEAGTELDNSASSVIDMWVCSGAVLGFARNERLPHEQVRVPLQQDIRVEGDARSDSLRDPLEHVSRLLEPEGHCACARASAPRPPVVTDSLTVQRGLLGRRRDEQRRLKAEGHRSSGEQIEADRVDRAVKVTPTRCMPRTRVTPPTDVLRGADVHSDHTDLLHHDNVGDCDGASHQPRRLEGAGRDLVGGYVTFVMTTERRH